jgi:hypothetical protein
MVHNPVVTWVIVLAALGLGYYVVHKMTPVKFLVRTSLARVFLFQMEIQSDKAGPEPAPALSRKRTQP